MQGTKAITREKRERSTSIRKKIEVLIQYFCLYKDGVSVSLNATTSDVILRSRTTATVWAATSFLVLVQLVLRLLNRQAQGTRRQGTQAGRLLEQKNRLARDVVHIRLLGIGQRRHHPNNLAPRPRSLKPNAEEMLPWAHPAHPTRSHPIPSHPIA